MHIPDGPLSLEVCLGTGALAAGAVALSLKRLNETLAARTVPLTAMVAALIFAGQMVKFPLVFAPSYGHLLGGVLASIVVGPWAGCVAMALVLFLQMALFADGGWLSFGANFLNMGVVGSLGGYAVYAAVRRRVAGVRGIIAASAIAAWISVIAASALFCIEFALSHPSDGFDLPRLFAVMTSVHSLVGVGEALITTAIVGYIVGQRPELVAVQAVRPNAVAGLGRLAWSGAIIALAIAAFVAPFAASGSDGLETVAKEMRFQDLQRPSRALVLSEYAIPLPRVDVTTGFWQKASVALAGVFGTCSVFGVTVLFGRALSRNSEE